MVDEAYREFNDPLFGDPVDLQETYKNLVVTRTFSKAFGLAGLRSGYAVCDPAIVRELDKVRLAFSVSNLSQAGMLAAIEHEDAAMVKVAELLAERTRWVSAPDAFGLEVSRFFEFVNDPAHGTLGNPYRIGDVALPELGVTADCDQHVGVVCEEGPTNNVRFGWP